MINFHIHVILSLLICQSNAQLDCNRISNYSCCYNQYLNNASNTCIECPDGRYGWNCKSPCPLGFYGRLCKSPCECIDSKCHYVAGCITTDDPQSGTTSATDAILNYKPLTFATGKVSTYQGIKSNGVDRYIHTEDDHASPMLTIGFSLIGSFSSLCIIGCVLLIRSRKKKFRDSQSITKIRQVSLTCVNEDHRQEVTHGSGDIELSSVKAAPVCEHEEDESPYSDIRYPQFIGGTTSGGACMNTVLCTIHKCNSDKHHNTSERQNIYQMSMNKNEYDHINLKVKSSDMLYDRNLRLPHSNDEEYVSVLNGPSLGTHVKPKDNLKCQNLTLSKHTTNDICEMDEHENKPHHLMTGYSLQQIKFEMEVELNISEKTKRQSEGIAEQICPLRNNRPYSMAGGLSENDLSEIVEEPLNLLNINVLENKTLFENNLSKAVEKSVNPIDIDISSKCENISNCENNVQTNPRPYSTAKIPEL